MARQDQGHVHGKRKKRGVRRNEGCWHTEVGKDEGDENRWDKHVWENKSRRWCGLWVMMVVGESKKSGTLRKERLQGCKLNLVNVV